jgi:hypothetical protein
VDFVVSDWTAWHGNQILFTTIEFARHSSLAQFCGDTKGAKVIKCTQKRQRAFEDRGKEWYKGQAVAANLTLGSTFVDRECLHSHTAWNRLVLGSCAGHRVTLKVRFACLGIIETFVSAKLHSIRGGGLPV